MPCALTTGFAIDCKESNGGISEILVTEFANKNSIAYTSDKITTFTLNTGKQFFKYEMPQEAASVTENVTANVQNGTIFYEQDVVLILNTLKTTARNELRLLSLNRLLIIAKDNNGRYWLVGEGAGADLDSGTQMTGTARGDRNGYELTFKGKEAVPMREVDSSLIAGLLVPAL